MKEKRIKVERMNTEREWDCEIEERKEKER